MVLSLDWDSLTEMEELVYNIELSFIVFTVLCAIGVFPSWAARLKKSEEER